MTEEFLQLLKAGIYGAITLKVPETRSYGSCVVLSDMWVAAVGFTDFIFKTILGLKNKYTYHGEIPSPLPRFSKYFCAVLFIYFTEICL